MPKQGEVVDAPFRANRRLMFVMRRFLYIAQSIQMLAFCYVSFVSFASRLVIFFPIGPAG